MDRSLDQCRLEVRAIKTRYSILIAGIPIIFLAVFYFYPLIKIFTLSFLPEGTLDLGGLKKLVSTSFYIKTLWFTTWQAAASTVLTLIIALPGAYVFARYRFAGKNLLQSFTAIPFVLPSVVVAAAFHALLGPNGLINIFLMKNLGLVSPPIQLNHTVWFILMAHVFYNYTVILRIVGGAWSRLQPSLVEAAHMLGASPLKAFMKVTLPLLLPSICAASLLVFIFCFSSFGVILILGGPRYATIEVEIYRQAVHIFNLPMAAALSLLQICFTFVFMWVYTWLQRRTSVALYPESRKVTQKKPAGSKDRIILGINISAMLLLLGAPLMALVIQSFTTDNGFSLLFYRAIFENTAQSIFYIPPVEAIGYSVGFALMALVFSLIIGLCAAIFLSGEKSRITSLLDPLFMLPLATSAVTLGFGYIIALDKPPLNLRTSIILVPLAHTLVAYPFIVRSVLPALRSIPKNLRESAAVLGASQFQTWIRVVMPIVKRALIVGAVFAFTVSIGEFGATVFVARPQTPTMPLAIYRFLGQPGALNYGQAMAMSTILMLVTAAGFLLLEKIRIGQEGEF
jgi:thiamine transport system permease protein